MSFCGNLLYLSLLAGFVALLGAYRFPIHLYTLLARFIIFSLLLVSVLLLMLGTIYYQRDRKGCVCLGILVVVYPPYILCSNTRGIPCVSVTAKPFGLRACSLDFLILVPFLSPFYIRPSTNIQLGQP